MKKILLTLSTVISAYSMEQYSIAGQPQTRMPEVVQDYTARMQPTPFGPRDNSVLNLNNSIVDFLASYQTVTKKPINSATYVIKLSLIQGNSGKNLALASFYTEAPTNGPFVQ